ncbi:hypothetical protein HPP92_011645 [Vanilla planifolia]|uniref:Pentatricopeptide repeat-containing protein n=1 Tax=Vanilla planifolia TaxID=51239 RepID=A0A835V0D8_VANPL|nr:hypothetical protein HPP92_011645 [Vanilla planifolia]
MNIARQRAPFGCLCQYTILVSLHPFSKHHQQQDLSKRSPDSPPTLDSFFSRLSSSPTPREFNLIHAYYTTSGLLRSNFTANNLLRASISISSHLTLLLFSQLHHPDIFSYNMAINSLSQTSYPLKSLLLYLDLIYKGIFPNEYTFCFLLDCCSHDLAIFEGMQLHAHLVKHGLHFTTYSCTSLLHMYSECKALGDAYQVFVQMPTRSNVSWGVMINAFFGHAEVLEGLRLFTVMLGSGFIPSNATLVSILCLCADHGELKIGRSLHGYITVNGLEINITLGTSLLDMYCKCGVIGMAMDVFAAMPVKNVASWNCLIRGMAINGHGAVAVRLYEEMKRDFNLRPDGLTFLNLLQACSHAGLIEKGVKYFTQMISEYGIVPSVKHYGCMVDLYGKAGRVKEAMEIVRSMHVKPDSVIWVALFNGCRDHGYRDLGEILAANVVKLVPGNSCGYLLLSDSYAMKRQWDDVFCVRRTMRELDITKPSGFSRCKVWL